jgi:acetylornithine deacetylase/succinyl-diaminopimelate desuccinylase-like protein
LKTLSPNDIRLQRLFLKVAAFLLFSALSLSAMAQSTAAYQSASAKDRQLAHDIFKQLIETNTSHSVGSVTAASQEIQQRLLDAGFAASDIALLGPSDRKQNLVARYRGTGMRKPILLLAHLDVVEALPSDWTTDPFQFVEKDGYFYGRGTQDIKENVAILVTNFIRLRRENYQPDRDLILALTADEENGPDDGVAWLVKNHRELLNVDFALNLDAGGVETEHGKPLVVGVEAAEKTYADYALTITDRGGHSSLPHPDNPIFHLAAALERLERSPFPFELNAVTRGYFSGLAPHVSEADADAIHAILREPPDRAGFGHLSQDTFYNALLRTTCVPTRLSAGHANNALPQSASANVNCRILPGHAPEEIRQELIRIFADPKITVRYGNFAGEMFDSAPDLRSFTPLPPRPDIIDPIKRIAAQMWPGAPVVSEMETGASDSVYTLAAGIPSYGVSGIAIDNDDIRAHGKDERLPVESFYRGLDFYYLYLKALSTPETQK